jgi:predicted esterase
VIVVTAPVVGDYGLRAFRIPSQTKTPAATFVLLHGIGLSHRFFSPLGVVPKDVVNSVASAE